MATLKRIRVALVGLNNNVGYDPKTSVGLDKLTDDFVSKTLDSLDDYPIIGGYALKYGNRLIVTMKVRKS